MLKEVEVLERRVRLLREQLLPVFASGCCDRCRHDTKVLARVVHAQVEEPFAMIDRVLLFLNAWCDQGERSIRRRRIEEVRLAGGVTACFKQQIAAIARRSDAEIEAFVGLMHDLRIGAPWVAERVPPQRVLPLGLIVLGGVEERTSVGGPGDRPHAIGGVGQVLTRA